MATSNDDSLKAGSDLDLNRKELEEDSIQVAKQAEEYMNKQSVLNQTHTWRRKSDRGPQSPVFYLHHCFKQLQQNE